MKRAALLRVAVRGTLSALTVGVAVGLAACQPPSPPSRVAVANQEPVAMLTVPEGAGAGVEVSFSAEGSLDVDGALASLALSFGDGAPAELRAPGDAPTWTHSYGAAGRYVVQLEVTDDAGLVGRARLPLVVAPPPELGPPEVTSLTLALDGEALAPGERVAAGSALDVAVSATDAEGNLVSALVEAGDTAIDVDLTSNSTGTGTLALPTVGGALVVRATALDRYGNRSAPREQPLLVVDAATDSDGDGIPDLDDPAPEVRNGLVAELFPLDALFDDGIPTDLLGNQRAERVVEALDGAAPAASTAVTAGYLVREPSGAALVDVVPGAPATPAGFVVRFAGFLEPPAGADAVVIEVEADDLGVVLLDGAAVASADEEYARDFFRFDRAPTSTEPIPIDGRTALQLIVADGAEAPYAWSFRFSFFADGQNILLPEAVGPPQFTSP